MGALAKSEAFMEMDVMDQQQIVAAATGNVIEELVYKVKGKTAISWMGINHICFFMGDIGVDDWVQWEKIIMFGDRVYWSATIRANNAKYGLSSLGTAEAPELADTYALDDQNNRIKNPDGSWQMTLRKDPHCRRKALSMAQRNGKRAVIPAVVLKKWLDYFLVLKTGKSVAPPFQPKFVESQQKPVTKPKTAAEKKKATDLKKAAAKKRKKKEKPKTQMSLGEVTVKTVTYNLKAVGFTEELLVVREEDDGLIVEPTRDLTEEEIYKISGVLEDVGAVFNEKGYHGQWTITKKAVPQ